MAAVADLVASRIGRSLLLAGATLALSGCFFGGPDKCERPQEYQQSRSIAELDIPADLDRPEGSERLVIPQASGTVTTDEETAPARSPCLEKPPDYFGRPIGGSSN